MKIWQKTKEWSEGKFLVIRRDGTKPAWPYFVLGARDPAAPAALRAYATKARNIGLDAEYGASIDELADDFEHYRLSAEQGIGFPDNPPHRKDDPATIAAMNGRISNVTIIPDQILPPKTKAEHTADENTNRPSFVDRIRTMNRMYKLPVHNTPTLRQPNPEQAVLAFQRTINEEITEFDPIVEQLSNGGDPVEALVDLLDLFADITVFCRSEAMKYGLPLEDALQIIMDSNESKLGADGQTIYNEDGKVMKGPNYWKPEPKLRKLIENLMDKTTV